MDENVLAQFSQNGEGWALEIESPALVERLAKRIYHCFSMRARSTGNERANFRDIATESVPK